MKISRYFAFLFVLLLIAVPALAKDEFLLNEEYSKNLYLTNNNIEINSNLYGDLFAFSEYMKISELVKDDINAVSAEFNLEGTIGSDLRLISSNAKIDGTIFGEALIMGNYVEISDSAAIGGRVKINANYVVINGTLKDDLDVSAEKVFINGVVEGDAIIKASSFELGPDARILGDLSSPNNIDEVAPQVSGTVTKTEGKESPDSFTSMTFRKIGLFMMLFLIGAALVFFGEKFTEKTSKAFQGRFLLSLMTGFVTLVAAPFIAIFIAFTFVGFPLAILIGLIYFTLLILSFGMSCVITGKTLLRLFKGRKNLWLELLIGALSLALLSILVPVFWALMLILIITSVGAFILVFAKKDKKK